MPRQRRYDPLVIATKSVFLQRVQEAVAAGYHSYVFGTVRAGRAIPLVMKFAERYGVDLDKGARFRRKAQGLGNARLLLFSQDPTELEFFLMVSGGEHAAHALEKLEHVKRRPPEYHELELVQLTRTGAAAPSWTWRLKSEAVEGWRERLHLHTAHYDKRALYQDFFSLYRTIGFAGARKQVGELVAFWRREWRKLRGDAPCPICYPHDEMRYRAIPRVTRGDDGMYWPTKGFPSVRQLPTLFYVRKQATTGERLSRFVAFERELLGRQIA